MPPTRKLLTRKGILKALERLSEILEARGVKADLYVIGGAAMTLAHRARPSTPGVYAKFKPKNEVFKAAPPAAREQILPAGCLNNAANKFLTHPHPRTLP